MDAKALCTGLGYKVQTESGGRVDEYQSSPYLTDQEKEAQGISKVHSVEEPPHMCKNQTHARRLTHSIL